MFDLCIVGGGIAGSLAAYQAVQQGLKVVLIDDGNGFSASRVAAGLLTPVIGKRWTVDRGLDWEAVMGGYRRLESEIGSSFLVTNPTVRYFQDDVDYSVYQSRCKDPVVSPFFGGSVSENSFFHAPLGGIELCSSSFVYVDRLFTGLMAYFQKKVTYIQDTFSHKDLEIRDRSIRWNKIEAKQLLFCEGAGVVDNPLFSSFSFDRTQSETFILSIPDLDLDHAVSKKWWLCPTGESGLYKFGATQQWSNIDGKPSQEGYDQLLEAANALLKVPFTVMDHQCGVKVNLKSRTLLDITHPDYPHIRVLAGLGSRGYGMLLNLFRF